MKRKLAWLLVLLALGMAALADEEQVAMRIVSCPEQGFSTLCKPEYDYYFVPDGGLTLELGEGDDAPVVTIFKTDEPGADFNAEAYLNNVYPDLIKRCDYDSAALQDVAVYNLGGRQLTARMVLYEQNGVAQMRFCAYDLREDCFVQYEAFSRQVDTEMEDALKALAVAVGNFQPDADYYAR